MRPENPIVEEAPIVPHVSHRPVQHRVRQRQVTGIYILEGQEGNDALRHRVNVDGIGPIMEITDRAVRAEEMAAIELETTPDDDVELSCRRMARKVPQRTEIIPSVKIIDPVL